MQYVQLQHYHFCAARAQGKSSKGDYLELWHWCLGCQFCKLVWLLPAYLCLDINSHLLKWHCVMPFIGNKIQPMNGLPLQLDSRANFRTMLINNLDSIRNPSDAENYIGESGVLAEAINLLTFEAFYESFPQMILQMVIIMRIGHASKYTRLFLKSVCMTAYMPLVLWISRE